VFSSAAMGLLNMLSLKFREEKSSSIELLF